MVKNSVNEENAYLKKDEISNKSGLPNTAQELCYCDFLELQYFFTYRVSNDFNMITHIIQFRIDNQIC